MCPAPAKVCTSAIEIRPPEEKMRKSAMEARKYDIYVRNNAI